MLALQLIQHCLFLNVPGAGIGGLFGRHSGTIIPSFPSNSDCERLACRPIFGEGGSEAGGHFKVRVGLRLGRFFFELNYSPNPTKHL